MKTKLFIVLLLFAVICVEGKKLSKSRSSSRGSSNSRKVSNPQPTSSVSNPQPAPKPSLFGWQETPAQRKQPSQRQPNSQSHSYPSSQTGLSGNQAKPPANSYPSSQSGLSGGTAGKQQETIQKSSVPQSSSGQHINNQQGHSYPASNGLSGSGTGASYPHQQGGLSGGGAAPPPYSGGNYHQQGPPPPYSQSGVGYPKQAPPPYSAGNYPTNNFGNNYHQQGPPPAYHGGYGGYGGYGGHGGYGGYNPMQTPQMPGYFGNSGGFGGVSRSSNVLKGVGIAGAGVGTILTGLALWNLARSTGQHRHTVIYDNRGQPVAVAPNNSTEPVVDPILGDLVNCTLTISTDNATEVLAIPCAIATSFTPEADVKDAGTVNNPSDNTKCTVTVVTKAGREFQTTIPCSTLLNTAAENNVTEPPLLDNAPEMLNGTAPIPDTTNLSQPSALGYSTGPDNISLNCTDNGEHGDIRDPINPCFAVNGNLTVIPLPVTVNSSVLLTTPGGA